MSILKKGKITVLLALLALSLTTTAYAKTNTTTKQTTTQAKTKEKKQDAREKTLEVLKDLGLDTQDQSQPAQQSTQQPTQPQSSSTQSSPTETTSTSQPGTAQYCFDNQLPLNQISPENCTKRLTAEQWVKLLPHFKGSDLSYMVEHSSIAIIHIPNITSYATTMNNSKLTARRRDTKNNRFAYFGLTNVRDQVIYYKDGTYKENTNVPMDKDLDDILFLNFPIVAKESNTPMQIFVFPDHFENPLISGVDGVSDEILLQNLRNGIK